MGCPIFKLLLVVQWTFLIQLAVAAPNASCNYYQELIFGEEYYFYNPNYPTNYSAGTSCYWDFRTVSGTKILLSCSNLMLPTSRNCNKDRLAVSLTGNAQFQDSKNYCGTETFSVLSQKTAITIGLFSPKYSEGGRFFCSVTAIMDTSEQSQLQAQAAPFVESSCDCGWQKMTRIVGGEETGVNEYAFMAALILQAKIWCGASIISNQFVLTAAHCVFGRIATDFFIIVGDHNLNSGSDTTSSALYKVNAYEIYPQYVQTSLQNDIALLRTQTQIIFNPKVGPICLPFRYTNADFAGQNVILLGWGQIEFTGALAKALQKVKVTVITNQQCSILENKNMSNGTLCTHSVEGKDACQNDSGGPVVWIDPSSGRYQLVGVISHGVGCGSNYPGINVRVTQFLQWIVQRTATSYCVK